MKRIFMILVAAAVTSTSGCNVGTDTPKAFKSKDELAQGLFRIMKNFSKTNKKEFIDNFLPVIPTLQTLQSKDKDFFNVSRAEHEDIYDEIRAEGIDWQNVAFVSYSIGNFPEKAADIIFNNAAITVKHRDKEIGIGFSYYEYREKYYLFFIRGAGYL
jgi:hypothetical protein